MSGSLIIFTLEEVLENFGPDVWWHLCYDCHVAWASFNDVPLLLVFDEEIDPESAVGMPIPEIIDLQQLKADESCCGSKIMSRLAQQRLIPENSPLYEMGEELKYLERNERLAGTLMDALEKYPAEFRQIISILMRIGAANPTMGIAYKTGFSPGTYDLMISFSPPDSDEEPPLGAETFPFPNRPNIIH